MFCCNEISRNEICSFEFKRSLVCAMLSVLFYVLLCIVFCTDAQHAFAATSARAPTGIQPIQTNITVQHKPRCVQDDAQHTICITKPTETLRVISLAPHLTESVAFVGGFNHLVAVDAASDYPQEVKGLKKLGGLGAIGPEHIIKHQPDLVLVWGSGMHRADIQKLQDFGVQVYVSEPNTIEDVRNTFVRLSILLGTKAVASQRVKVWWQSWKTVFQHNQLGEAKKSHSQKPKVFFQVWNSPVMTLGGKHIISDIIHRCGGVNVYGSVPQLSFTVQRESVLVHNPDLFLTTAQPAKHNVALQTFKAEWNSWYELQAVKKNAFVVLSADEVVRMGPRLLLGAQLICQAINTQYR